MKALTTVVVFGLASCATVPSAQAGPTAALGGTAYTNGLKVQPLAVVEDSRCPTNVQCVWAGRLVVRSEVHGGSWRKILDLELGKPQQVADGALTLIAVTPEKVAGTNTEPLAYHFTFDFQGGL
jgi:hypothetical protein